MKPASRHAGLGGRRSMPRQVRIIGGRWKRTPLSVPDIPGLRPTPDRVRETVFNWMTHLNGGDWDDCACLDLFSGTGALGFEAASRGAKRVVLVETSPVALRQLAETCGKLDAKHVEIIKGDAFGVLQRLKGEGSRFDLVFLDPPYQQGWLPRLLPACLPLIKDDGYVYAESAEALVGRDADVLPDWLDGWEIARSGRAGMVHYYLLRRLFKA